MSVRQGLQGIMMWVMLIAVAAAGSARPAPDSFRDIVQRLSPTVVNISTMQAVPGKGPIAAPLTPAVPDAGPQQPLAQMQKERLSGGSAAGTQGQSLGSGFIIDPAGFIVTNQHVIADASVIVVTMHDGTRLLARLVGVDRKTDLALLKVNPRAPLPAVTFGDSDKTEVGDWVVVIGNPYGLGGSVSAGIVSARNRELNLGSYDDFIQTDAAINSGNSGGPLFNIEGEVIGVNSALLSPSGGSVGIGFAISASLARPVIAQLREFGETRRGWIGVRVQTVTPDIAETLGLPKPTGALVASVTTGGPADEAGLEPGDVILRFDGKEIADMRFFPRTVAESAIGKPAAADVFRKGKSLIFQVPVERLEDNDRDFAAVRRAAHASATPAPARPNSLGLSLAPLTPELRTRFAVPGDVEGAIVLAVEPGSIGADNEVRVGDVVVEVGQARVSSLEDVKARLDAAGKARKRVVLFGLSRRGEMSFKALKLAGL
ncbi:MAG TPA: serine protease [Alphaproteobacteria bacterium]|nr:serine protease [Alphaproteobacteria bacterium]HAJ48428.1 serine protease [Alphaproteobacteria bacterium]